MLFMILYVYADIYRSLLTDNIVHITHFTSIFNINLLNTGVFNWRQNGGTGYFLAFCQIVQQLNSLERVICHLFSRIQQNEKIFPVFRRLILLISCTVKGNNEQTELKITVEDIDIHSFVDHCGTNWMTCLLLIEKNSLPMTNNDEEKQRKWNE
jgi:hypothetical protein